MSIMKNFNLKAILTLTVATLLLSGCASLKKMQKNADLVKWNVTPEVLEANAGEVEVSVEAQIPAEYFLDFAEMTVTPVLKYDGGEASFPALKLQGEEVVANNKVVSYDNGGSFSVKGSVPYEAAMRMSELVLDIQLAKAGTDKTATIEAKKVADGVISTSEMVQKLGAPILGVQADPEAKSREGEVKNSDYDASKDEFQRVLADEFIADVHFLINSSYVRGTERKGEDVDTFSEYVKDAYTVENKKLKDVEVSAYASPDGEMDWNDKLSQQRESSASKFLARSLKKAGVDVELKTSYTAEDWEGFKELLEKSNIQDKELILRVLTMYTDPEVRENEIRNLSEAFTAVADDILPELRRAKFIVEADLIGKSDDEILAAAKSDASSLTEAELLYAATLTEDANEKLSFYNAFTKNFSSDWRGYNNIGVIYVRQGNLSAAAEQFEIAAKNDPSNIIVKNNLGIIALANGETAKAKELFSAASGVAPQVDYNLGIISILEGDYNKAVSYFGECTKPNAALAKILAGDNSGALKTLESSESEDATIDYLKAVVGARTSKENLVMESLTAAVAKDASLKASAKTDLEFAKYFDNATFKGIVE